MTERDPDGDLFVRPAAWGEEGPCYRLAPAPDEVRAGAPGVGDRVLVRYARNEAGETEARLVKRLGQSAHQVLGVVRRHGREVRIEPADRRARQAIVLGPGEGSDLPEGELVTVQVAPEARPYGPKRGRVLARLGSADAPRAASVIALHAHGLPTGFSSEALAEAERARPAAGVARENLTTLPLVTIDPAEARDHDDAVFAEPDPDPRNRGGWVCWVAIADVAAHVAPGSALDGEGREKGNSAYFPDRVEPMLPERLSADRCSLVEGELRPCLAVRMIFDAQGRKRDHRFVRGLMRCAASLAYEEVQEAFDGEPNFRCAELWEGVLAPLRGAFAALETERARRAPLAIESLERKVELAPDGSVLAIRPRASLEANRLIEAFMVWANVCAAETLEARRTPLIYRVHEAPTRDKIDALADFLATLGIPWSKGEAPRTDRFNRLLEQVRGGESAEIVNEVVLRTQMQARYATENLGHFGLNLDRYAHFTSPIRRYADLMVHRALISALDLGPDGLSGADRARLQATAEHVSLTERRAMAAERDAQDRYVALFLSERVGASFEGRITGVTRFGLFVRLAETGADGLVPIRSLGGEYWTHDERAHALVGERSGAVWRLGRKVEVRLAEAAPITGGVILEMLSEPETGEAARGPASRRGRFPRGPRRRPGGR